MDETPSTAPEPETAGAPAGASGGTPAEKAGDATVAAAGNPAEKAGAEQVHTDAAEPAGRAPAERGREGTDTPPARNPGAGTPPRAPGSSSEREV
jgi:NADH-quinone oxidoreductase subunit E